MGVSMRILAAISDEQGELLDDFKRKHEKCTELFFEGFDVDPELLFDYSFAQTPLGFLFEVECRCGATLAVGADGVHEYEARRERRVKSEDFDVEAIRELLRAARRPWMYLGPPFEDAWLRFIAFEAGLSDGIFIARGRSVHKRGCYAEVMERFHVRLRENELAGSPNPGGADDDIEKIRIWADELRACIEEEFPQVAEELGFNKVS